MGSPRDAALTRWRTQVAGFEFTITAWQIVPPRVEQPHLPAREAAPAGQRPRPGRSVPDTPPLLAGWQRTLACPDPGGHGRAAAVPEELSPHGRERRTAACLPDAGGAADRPAALGAPGPVTDAAAAGAVFRAGSRPRRRPDADGDGDTGADLLPAARHHGLAARPHRGRAAQAPGPGRRPAIAVLMFDNLPPRGRRGASRRAALRSRS